MWHCVMNYTDMASYIWSHVSNCLETCIYGYQRVWIVVLVLINNCYYFLRLFIFGLGNPEPLYMCLLLTFLTIWLPVITRIQELVGNMKNKLKWQNTPSSNRNPLNRNKILIHFAYVIAILKYNYIHHKILVVHISSDLYLLFLWLLKHCHLFPYNFCPLIYLNTNVNK